MCEWHIMEKCLFHTRRLRSVFITLHEVRCQNSTASQLATHVVNKCRARHNGFRTPCPLASWSSTAIYPNTKSACPRYGNNPTKDHIVESLFPISPNLYPSNGQIRLKFCLPHLKMYLPRYSGESSQLIPVRW